MPKRPGSSNTLRIIGGIHRGRKLSFPDAPGLRPTADRLRETLFNWLQNQIAGSRCLDLFAGSGALGFEAASRGARQVVMIEPDNTVVQNLKANVKLFDLEPVISVIKSRASSWMQQYEGPNFNIVFLDPPFAQQLLSQTIQLMVDRGLLAEHGYVYIERDLNQPLPKLPVNWEVIRDKTASQVAYSLIQRID